jgi:hypothetical protein
MCHLRLVALLVATVSVPSVSLGATDPRFFGTFCGDETVRACGRVCLPPFGYPCFTRCRNVALDDIVIRVQHKESTAGSGSILGTGTATIDGKPLKLNVSAVVTGFGRAKGFVASNRFDARSGEAVLASDGVTITVSSEGQSITLSKERCGNAPPSVRITAPTDGSVLEFRTAVLFRGEVTDAEDAAFPPERMLFTSNRDGPLSGAINAQARSLEVSTNALTPGAHEVTFRATDSGGLSSTAAVRVTVAGSLRYAAKFLCGKPPGDSAARGTYFTAVNVLNPSDATVAFRKRFSLGLAEQKPGVLTDFEAARLEPRRAFRVECEEIMRVTGSEGFAEGFVIIETPEALNVVAVYSAAGANGSVETLDVETVGGIRVAMRLPDLVVEGLCDLSVRVRNIGAASAGPSVTKVEIDGRTVNLQTPPIDAGGVVTIPVTGARPSGDFGMRVTADTDRQVVESSETNNIATVTCIGLQPAPAGGGSQ